MAEVKFSAPPLGKGDANRCRVFIPCRSTRFDMTDLRRFGRSVVVVNEIHSLYPDQDISDKYIDTTTLMLTQLDFNPQFDYVALLGDSLLTAFLCMALGRHYTNVTFLRYDTQSAGYWPCTVV